MNKESLLSCLLGLSLMVGCGQVDSITDTGSSSDGPVQYSDLPGPDLPLNTPDQLPAPEASVDLAQPDLVAIDSLLPDIPTVDLTIAPDQAAPDAALKCGNSVIDVGEECDGQNLAGLTCAKLGFAGGLLFCSKICKLDTSNCKTCGNGKVNAGEECDGSQLDGKSCLSLGFTAGKLACQAATCTYDKSGCYKCGDNTINPGEDCDGPVLNATCLKLKYDGGYLSCAPQTCKFVTAGCYKCGDGKKNGPEKCDGLDLAGQTCVKAGFFAGTLACSGSCNSLDTSKCYNCGNNKIDTGEECDGTSLASKTCISEGFDTGVLKCDGSCKLDKSGCAQAKCNNGTVEGKEECDGTNLAGATCKTKAYAGGVLSCTKNCKYDFSSCYKCGDGKKNGAEVCDGAVLGGKVCTDFSPYHSGTLACKKDCTSIDLSGCNKCGDGKKNGTEKCDGIDLGSQTCKDIGLTFGQLKCTTACGLDSLGCYSCSDGTLNGLETDIDCGGGLCSGCLTGKVCKTSGDCFHKICSGGKCIAPTCTDGAANGPETDVDCGGNTCPRCTHGKNCTKISDCLGGACTSGKCIGCPAATVTKSCSLDSTLGLTFCNVPKGCFSMGSPATEPCRSSTNETRHMVTLTNGFEMMSTEVTQGSFKAEMGFNPTWFSNCGSQCPADGPNWQMAAAFCNALSKKAGKTACYSCTGSAYTISCSPATAYSGKAIYKCPGYRLPTDAEWEYAYRAGTTTAVHSGKNDSTLCQVCNIKDVNLDKIGWYWSNAAATYSGCYNYQQSAGCPKCIGPQPVAQKMGNALGLYDMAGNVSEYSHDIYKADLGTAAMVDPVVTGSGLWVRRGGAWPNNPLSLRAAARSSGGSNAPTTNRGCSSCGFRCVRTTGP